MSGRRAEGERAARAEQPQQPRRRKLVLAIAALILVLAAAAATTLAVTRSGSSTSSTGPVARGGSASAPLQLSGTDPVTSKRVSLASYAGKPIVLNMWASWCTGCYAEARALATFARTHPQAQVVGIDIQDTKAAAASFYHRFGWRHPSIFDPSGTIAAKLGLQGLPTTLFLDRRHRVVARVVGETDLAGFNAGFRRAQG